MKRRSFIQAVFGIVAAVYCPALVVDSYMPDTPMVCVWVGAISGNFADPRNWAGGIVPGERDTAMFNGQAERSVAWIPCKDDHIDVGEIVMAEDFRHDIMVGEQFAPASSVA